MKLHHALFALSFVVVVGWIVFMACTFRYTSTVTPDPVGKRTLIVTLDRWTGKSSVEVWP